MRAGFQQRSYYSFTNPAWGWWSRTTASALMKNNTYDFATKACMPERTPTCKLPKWHMFFFTRFAQLIKFQLRDISNAGDKHKHNLRLFDFQGRWCGKRHVSAVGHSQQQNAWQRARCAQQCWNWQGKQLSVTFKHECKSVIMSVFNQAAYSSNTFESVILSRSAIIQMADKFRASKIPASTSVLLPCKELQSLCLRSHHLGR